MAYAPVGGSLEQGPQHAATRSDPAPPMAGDGTPDGLLQLYLTQRTALVRLAILLMDDAGGAEDIVQEAFAELHLRWDRLRDERAALGYLRRCVVNGARSTLRRRRTARRHPPPYQPPEAPADVGVLLAEEHRAVLGAIGALPPRQREVIALRYWSELSERQIAEAMGISVGAVKSAASRALASVRAALVTTEEER